MFYEVFIILVQDILIETFLLNCCSTFIKTLKNRLAFYQDIRSFWPQILPKFNMITSLGVYCKIIKYYVNSCIFIQSLKEIEAWYKNEAH